VKFGYTGLFTASVQGPVTPDKQTKPIPWGQTVAYTVNIPANTAFARFATFAADYPPGTDVDIQVVYNNVVLGSGTGSTADEQVDVASPAAGAYTVNVTAWSADGLPLNTNLYDWAVGTAPSTVVTMTAPTSATTGTAGTISFAVPRSAPSGRYVGFVSYSGTQFLPGPTAVHFTK